MILFGNLHAGGQTNLGHLSLLHRYIKLCICSLMDQKSVQPSPQCIQ